MNKAIDHRAGDRWTKDKDGDLWLYRGDRCFAVCETGCGIDAGGSESYRYPHETDLPTPEAHAQLREWGYEIRGEPQQHTTGFITTSPVIDGATWTLPPNTEPTKTLGERVAALEAEVSELKKDAEDDDATLDDTLGFIDTRHDKIEARLAKLEALPESRVREILAEEIDRKTREIENFYDKKYDDLVSRVEKLEAKAKPAPALNSWQKMCRVVYEPTGVIGKDYGVVSPSRSHYWEPSLSLWLDHLTPFQKRGRFSSEDYANDALSKAPMPPDVIEVGDGVPYGGKTYRIIESAKSPPPPDVSPEPDWRGLLAEVVAVCETIAREQPLGDFRNHPALSSARTKLAAAGKAVGK